MKTATLNWIRRILVVGLDLWVIVTTISTYLSTREAQLVDPVRNFRASPMGIIDCVSIGLPTLGLIGEAISHRASWVANVGWPLAAAGYVLVGTCLAIIGAFGFGGAEHWFAALITLAAPLALGAVGLHLLFRKTKPSDGAA